MNLCFVFELFLLLELSQYKPAFAFIGRMPNQHMKKIPQHILLHLQLKPPNLMYGDQFYLQYCHRCKKDNYIPDIKYGKCAWCDWDYYKEIKSL